MKKACRSSQCGGFLTCGTTQKGANHTIDHLFSTLSYKHSIIYRLLYILAIECWKISFTKWDKHCVWSAAARKMWMVLNVADLDEADILKLIGYAQYIFTISVISQY